MLEDFRTLVLVWWNETPSKISKIITFVTKIKHYRERVKEWSTINFYSIAKAKKEKY